MYFIGVFKWFIDIVILEQWYQIFTIFTELYFYKKSGQVNIKFLITIIKKKKIIKYLLFKKWCKTEWEYFITIITRNFYYIPSLNHYKNSEWYLLQLSEYGWNTFECGIPYSVINIQYREQEVNIWLRNEVICTI